MIKLSLFNNKKVIIEKYNILKEIDDKKIIIDLYIINGEFLKIKKMNSYMLEINGTISSIQIKENDE